MPLVNCVLGQRHLAGVELGLEIGFNRSSAAPVLCSFGCVICLCSLLPHPFIGD